MNWFTYWCLIFPTIFLLVSARPRNELERLFVFERSALRRDVPHSVNASGLNRQDFNPEYFDHVYEVANQENVYIAVDYSNSVAKWLLEEAISGLAQSLLSQRTHAHAAARDPIAEGALELVYETFLEFEAAGIRFALNIIQDGATELTWRAAKRAFATVTATALKIAAETLFTRFVVYISPAAGEYTTLWRGNFIGEEVPLAGKPLPTNFSLANVPQPAGFSTPLNISSILNPSTDLDLSTSEDDGEAFQTS